MHRPPHRPVFLRRYLEIPRLRGPTQPLEAANRLLAYNLSHLRYKLKHAGISHLSRQHYSRKSRQIHSLSLCQSGRPALEGDGYQNHMGALMDPIEIFAELTRFRRSWAGTFRPIIDEESGMCLLEG